MRLKRGLALTIGLGAAAWVGTTTLRGRDRGSSGLSTSTMSSGVARSAQVAKIGGRAGGTYALHRARRVFADAERRESLDTEFEMKTAAHIAESLGNMKGAMMKLGQMASYLDAGMPPHVREALAQLQSDAPPMSAELAAGVVEAELGAPPDVVFAEWDPVPIASASIGQVHRAMTKDGVAVAVKVQYPGVDEAIESDLGSANLLFGGLAMLFPGLDSGPVVEELRERLVEELDYRLEADNQRFFADAYRDHPFIDVPEVIDELSTRRVLTTELADGVRFDEMLQWSQDERDLAAETLFRFVFRSMYGLQAFNGDPHPGNYLFRPGGHVVFLDYGLVKRFTDDEVEVFSSMLRSFVFDGDVVSFRATLDEIGLLPADAEFDEDLVVEYFGHFYEWVLADEEKTMTPEYGSESVRRFFDASGPYGEIMKAANVPPSFVIVQRINLGLYALMGDMHATRNWRRISEEIWPFTDGPPSTPTGIAEQEWLAAQ
ncbi:ABC1 kinase family protein [Actinospongicola halichondriae]|uniref:ABC1 kinase family protein n=1 Tax=Actinospongicola halichondriae TaxID=3236844 RepID=UPI003D4B1314